MTPERWKCPQGKTLLIPSQVIETAYPAGRGHLTLPLHADGTLCGPWCQDVAEAEKKKRWCDGYGTIRKARPGVYGPGMVVGVCDGCPKCADYRQEQAEQLAKTLEKLK